MQNESVRNITNFLLFQAGWFFCVLYPGLIGAGVVVAVVGFHLLFISRSPGVELQFIGAGTVIGGILDGIWFNTGVLTTAQPGTEGETFGDVSLTPIWIVGIWAAFMTTLSHSLSWISSKAWLPFVCAPIAGPFAYWSASKMGAVDLPDLTVSLIALAVGWLLVFPLLLYLQRSLYPELVK